MENIFNNIDQYIIIADKNGCVKFCNNSFLSKVGYSFLEFTKSAGIKKVVSEISKECEKVQFEVLTKYNRTMKFYGKILNINYNDEEGKIFIGDINYNKSNGCINRIKENSYEDNACVQSGKRREIEQELEVVLSTTSELIAIIDKKGNFQKVGEGWYKTFGWTAEESKNIKWQDLFHPKERKKVLLSVIRGRNKNKIIKGTNLYRCKNKSYKLIHWQCRYIKEREIYVGSALDITEITEVKNEARRYEKALIIEGIKNKFFANMSHEFKTPLNVIFSAVQLMEYNLNGEHMECEKRPNFDKYISAIKKNSYRLLKLVNNLIDISKMDVGNYKIRLSNNDIVYLLDEIICSVNLYTRGKDFEIIFDPEVEELELAYDSKEIERVLLNIISNAIKYSKDGGTIYIKLRVKNDKVIISVKDNGIGIKDYDLDNIFRKFNKVENIILEKTEGSGIGLAISKEIIKMHGGEIWVESEYGVGSTFYFSLPIRSCSCLEEDEYSQNSYIERCNIEFSDIYNFSEY